MSAAEDRKARMLAAVRAEPSPARAAVKRRELAGLTVGAPLVAIALLLAVGGVRMMARPPSLVLVSTLLWGALAAASTGIALRRGPTMLGARRGTLILAALAVVPLLGASWFSLPWPSAAAAAPHPSTGDLACFLVTMGLAAAPLFVFLRVRREGDPVHPLLTGAMAGAAAGAWGATLLDLHCERVDRGHILLGHLAPVALLVVAGALSGRWALRVSAAKAL